MIWTAITFVIVFFVLRKLAFGRIQALIDQRRDRIREALDAADQARDEARALLEEHRKLIAEARAHSEEILVEARKDAEAQRERVRALGCDTIQGYCIGRPMAPDEAWAAAGAERLDAISGPS